ncbi:MAG: D-alanine--poly(phosphoribitol) ligase subunit DltA [Sporolactobacillus sp.]
MTILQAIKANAVSKPNTVCFCHRDEQLTFQQLEDDSNAVACWIADHFPNDHHPIIVHGHMGIEMPVLFLGCVKAGHAYIPVDLSIPAERIALIAESAAVQLVFSAEEDILPSLQAAIVNADELLSLRNGYHNSQPQLSWQLTAEDTFYIIYTSGSTGRPKGVQIPLRALESFVNWMTGDFGFTDSEVFLNQAPFSFDLSVMDLYPCLVTGGTLWAVDKTMISYPKDLFASFAASGMTVWTSTPSFAEMCLMDPSFSASMLPKLHTFLFCGETLPVSIARKLHERFPSARIINTYGPTETTVAVTSVTVTEEMLTSDEALPVGASKPDGQILILGADKQASADGVKGEIIICGESVGNGYLGQPDKTAEAFETINGMRAYHTNDVGMLKEGQLYYFGRMDHQIKLHGFRMELEEIEHVLLTSQYVKQALVVPIKKGDRYDHLVAMIVPEDNEWGANYKLTKAIRDDIADTLPAYMIPRKFVYQTAFPMTANGKVDRKALLAEAIS